jgi:hypothetical protein
MAHFESSKGDRLPGEKSYNGSKALLQSATCGTVFRGRPRHDKLMADTRPGHREAERRREEAARERDRERREKATAKAQAALDKAEREHAKKVSLIQAEVEALEKRSRAEDDRWEKERERLQAALRRARE